MSKFVMVLFVGLMLAGCKSNDAKNFSAGCQYGAAGALGSLGLSVPQEIFQKPCDAGAQAYVNGKLNKPAPESKK